MRRLECRQSQTTRNYGSELRVGSQIALEPLRVEPLRHQTDIGEGQLFPEAVRAAVCLPAQLVFQGPEAVGDPALDPGKLGILADAEGAGQMLQHPQVVQRMDIAGDMQGKGPDFGALQWVGRQ